WNRLTQDLIDSGTYTTGTAKPQDVNGDGEISHQEYNAEDLERFRGGLLLPGTQETYAELQAKLGGDLSAFNLVNPGTTKLDGSNVLVAPEDRQTNEALTLYMDTIVTTASGWQWKNQLFFEHYDNLSENAYGFSEFHDTWVVEDKLVIAKTFSLNDLTAAVQLSPSVRHTDFEHADDFANEHFDRRDLTQPSTALDKRVLATRIGRDYSSYYLGDYTNLGLAAMADLVWDNGFSALLGLRYDSIDVASRQPADKLPPPTADTSADDRVGGASWTLSLSYATAAGFIPYITASRQSTLIVGQGAEASVANILSDGVFDESKLLEAGLKASLLNDSLYFALSLYRQERTDFSAQSIVTNQASETE
ncbi:MAG: TonB-dependent receptor domain-containing protein, partial [Pseudomonadales bacterium]